MSVPKAPIISSYILIEEELAAINGTDIIEAGGQMRIALCWETWAGHKIL